MQRPGFEADRFQIVLADLKSGARRVLTLGWDRSAAFIAFSADSRTLYATTDHFGQHPLWSIDVKTGKPTLLTGPGRVEAFSVGEREIVFSLSSLKSPAELYAMTLRNGELRELPRMAGAQLADVALGEPEQFTFVGANGETVYGHVMKPTAFDPKRRYPIAFIVHGGPQVSFGNVELSLESADLRRRRLRVDLHRLPWLAGLRPGVHGFDQRRLGRQAARRSAERARGGTRALSVAGRPARLSGVTSLSPLAVTALYVALISALVGVNLFALGVTFNYLVSLFYNQPIRQGLFGKPLFKTPLDQQFGWMGLLAMLLGLLIGCISLFLGWSGWEVNRLWFYLTGAALSFLVGLQLVVYYILFRILDELSQRASLTRQDLNDNKQVG